MNRTTRWLAAVVALICTVGLSAGCNDAFNEPRGLGDAPVGEKLEAERDVILMPNNYPNMALVCDGTTRLYVATRTGAFPATIVAVPNSPECPGSGN